MGPNTVLSDRDLPPFVDTTERHLIPFFRDQENRASFPLRFWRLDWLVGSTWVQFREVFEVLYAEKLDEETGAVFYR